MPFGLTNGPATFQRARQDTFRSLQWETCLTYLDDILIFGRTFTEHLQRLQQVFDRLQSVSFTLKPDKCHFLKKEIEYLGHIITPQGVMPNPKLLHAI